jgi:chloride channel 7
MVTFAIGVITGCLATSLSYCVSILSSAKLDFIQEQMDVQAATGNYAKAVLYGFLWFWLFGGIMVTIATSMVQYWAPASAGAGVTLVMAFLNGNHIPNLLRFSTLITKFIG